MTVLMTARWTLRGCNRQKLAVMRRAPYGHLQSQHQHKYLDCDLHAFSMRCVHSSKSLRCRVIHS